MNWQKVARDLARLAEDQQGKPEGELARAKLAEIQAKHPEALVQTPAPAVGSARARRPIVWDWTSTSTTAGTTQGAGRSWIFMYTVTA